MGNEEVVKERRAKIDNGAHELYCTFKELDEMKVRTVLTLVISTCEKEAYEM